MLQRSVSTGLISYVMKTPLRARSPSRLPANAWTSGRATLFYQRFA